MNDFHKLGHRNPKNSHHIIKPLRVSVPPEHIEVVKPVIPVTNEITKKRLFNQDVKGFIVSIIPSGIISAVESEINTIVTDVKNEIASIENTIIADVNAVEVAVSGFIAKL